MVSPNIRHLIHLDPFGVFWIYCYLGIVHCDKPPCNLLFGLPSKLSMLSMKSLPNMDQWSTIVAMIWVCSLIPGPHTFHKCGQSPPSKQPHFDAVACPELQMSSEPHVFAWSRVAVVSYDSYDSWFAAPMKPRYWHSQKKNQHTNHSDVLQTANFHLSDVSCGLICLTVEIPIPASSCILHQVRQATRWQCLPTPPVPGFPNPNFSSMILTERSRSTWGPIPQITWFKLKKRGDPPLLAAIQTKD